jgi:hypothetical protein
MLSTKTHTAFIALVASTAFVTASVAPIAAQARPRLKVPPVTCPDIDGSGTHQPGEIITIWWNEVNAKGELEAKKTEKICGSDGKWHTVVDLVQGGSLTNGLTATSVGAIQGPSQEGSTSPSTSVMATSVAALP